MCDERTAKQNEEFFQTNPDLSRRQLGKAAAGSLFGKFAAVPSK